MPAESPAAPAKEPEKAPEQVVAPAEAAAQPQAQNVAPYQWQPAAPKIIPLVTHNTRIPVEMKERLMRLANSVSGETQSTILIRALEREMDRMERELNAKFSRQN